MLLYRLGHYLRHNLWVVPLLCVLFGIGLALATTAIDRSFDYGLVSQTFTGSPAAAQSILNMICSSMVTLTSVVLTLTLVVVQLAMGRFSRRIVRPAGRPSEPTGHRALRGHVRLLDTRLARGRPSGRRNPRVGDEIVAYSSLAQWF